jgi:hypothetical protein
MACSPGAVEGRGGDNNPGDLDPNNPPPPPFDDNPFPEDGVCGDINAVVDGLTPTVQLLIDQSGSMDERFGGTDRWNAVYSTLMGADGVVPRLQSAVRFGLSLYTSYNGNQGGACPAMTTVSPALDNFDSMNAQFAPARPEEDTPTGASIDAAVAQLQADQGPGRKILVLGTDGLPDTCAIPDPETPQEEATAQQESIAAAQRAFDAGIRVFVVSVGDQVGAAHLQDMANAGAGLPVGGTENEEYFEALDAQALADAFGTIVGGAAGCVFTINGEVDRAKGAQGLVALDGEELSYGDEWVLIDGKSFEILGEACDIIKDGNLHHVSATFPCGSIQID